MNNRVPPDDVECRKIIKILSAKNLTHAFWIAARDPALTQIAIGLAKRTDVIDSTKSAALRQAACRGDTKLVAGFLAAKVQVNTFNYYGETALGMAARNGHVLVIEELLAAGATVDEGGLFTPLMLASSGGHDKAVAALLKAKANVNARSRSSWASDPEPSSGSTALMLAVAKGHIKIVRLLLDAKADPNIEDEFGNTAMNNATHFNYPDIIRLLFEYGARIPQHSMFEFRSVG